MHTNEFNNVLNELTQCTYTIADDRNHLAYSEGFSIFAGYNRKDIIKNIEENEIRQHLLKKKLIQLYNDTLTV